MNIEIQIVKYNLLKLILNDREGTLSFEEEFMNRGPFFQPLLNNDFFSKCFFNEEEGLIEWPNGFGIAVNELYEELEFQSHLSIC
jgi:hypothetical protein